MLIGDLKSFLFRAYLYAMPISLLDLFLQNIEERAFIMASDDSEERSAFGFSDIVSVALAIAMVVVGVQVCSTY